ncbi:MAG: glycerol-3-phosphate dehydrogenase, partial [Leifsonia sp.]|nr:glycerol-3-phosphate dehydrogenase [Leifsonia sp.]
EKREVRTYLRRVEAERSSQMQPDDESADRIGLEAPDIVEADAAAAKAAAGKPAGSAKAGTPTSADQAPKHVQGAGAEEAPATDG